MTIAQRTLRYETYVMPAPEEDHARFYEHLLRRNRKLYGATFCIGEEDAVFLAGQLGRRPIASARVEKNITMPVASIAKNDTACTQ